MESEDYSFFKNLDWLLENNVEDLGSELTFSTEIQEFGVTETRELTPNGKNMQVLHSTSVEWQCLTVYIFQVTDSNKQEYVRLVCQMKMTGAIRKQLAFSWRASTTSFPEGLSPYSTNKSWSCFSLVIFLDKVGKKPTVNRHIIFLSRPARHQH